MMKNIYIDEKYKLFASTTDHFIDFGGVSFGFKLARRLIYPALAGQGLPGGSGCWYVGSGESKKLIERFLVRGSNLKNIR